MFCAPLLQEVVREGILSTLPSGADEPAVIFSRAGHDGMAIGAIADVGMLFLRNPGGVSHHPDESVSTGDVARGIQAFAEAVLQLAADRGSR
ncbi:MAG: amaB [Microbacterium sp.]|nr:amaB [Microbacterium sp.]